MNHSSPKWVWELPDWPRFRWDRDAIRPFVDRFVEGAAWQSGAISFVGGEELVRTHVAWLTGETVESAQIEGESLERASVRASLLHHFGLGPRRQSGAAAQRAASLVADAYETFDEPLSRTMLHRWHRRLMEGRLATAGAYRSGAESVRIVSYRPRRDPAEVVHYLGPPGDRVRHEMERFVAIYNERMNGAGPPDALETAGAIHVHFEAIHPFQDGNGRIGRALAEKALAQCLGRPSLIPLSRAIAATRPAYYKALGACNASLDATSWQRWFAGAAVGALDESRERLVRHAAENRLLQRLNGRINPRQGKVLRRLFAAEPGGFEGGLSARNYRAITGASRATATRDLADLVATGALERSGRGRYTRYRLAPAALLPPLLGAVAGARPVGDSDAPAASG